MLRTILLTLALFSAPLLGAPKPVELLPSSKPLAPTTTFELRFVDSMVAREQVGKPAESPPLIIRPALKGRFVWTSPRSGVFTPQEPLPLSTTLEFTLRPDLKNADGESVATDFRETVQTPGLELKGSNPTRYFDTSDAPAEPRFVLLFTANIDIERAAKFAEFSNAKGETIPALVRQAAPAKHPDEYFPTWRTRDNSLLTWAEKFSPPAEPAHPRSTSRGNHLLVQPIRPLTPTDEWKLTLLAGLPSREPHVTLLESAEIPVGKVRPFEVASVEPENAINSGRRLIVSFSKPLAKDVTANNVARWIRVEPEPENLRAEMHGEQIQFRGGFALDTEYRVEVHAGLPAAEPFVLATPFEHEVAFTQVPPRLYFEKFATHQLSSGHRQFHLLAINVPRIRVTAKLFQPDTLASVLTVYRKYDESHRNGRSSPDEPHAKVELDGIPGRTVWQREIAGSAEVDVQRPIALEWDEIIGADRTGVVLLTAEGIRDADTVEPIPGTQALVQVTDIGAVWKTVKGEFFVHLFSLAKGDALAGAKVRLLNAENETLSETTADASGVGRLAAPENYTWLLAEHGGDLHLVDLCDGRGELYLRQIHVRSSDEEGDAEAPARAFLFSDRGVYKPGDTVHLKAIGNAARIGAGTKAQLRVFDARDREFLTKSVTVSGNRSIAEDVALPEGTLGTFRAELRLTAADDLSFATHHFEVQEYRPNPFEISIGGLRDTLGEATLALPVTAKYYMGKPLSKARLTWSIDASDDGFSPAGFEAFDFCDAIDDLDLRNKLGRFASFSRQGEAELDAQGAAQIETLVPLNSKAPQPRSARVLCEITDLDQHTVSKSERITLHSSDFYLGLRRAAEVVREGEALPIEIIALKPDGDPLPEPVTVTLRLTRVSWHTNRIETAGRAWGYRSQPRFELVDRRALTTSRASKRDGKWVFEKSEDAPTPLLAGQPGEYLLEVTATDAGGREVLTSTSFHVHGKAETVWNYRNPYEIDLVADRDEYKAGETATLIVKTPIQGEALVTIEREKVIRSFVTRLVGNAPSVKVPLEDVDAPNVFVSVMLLRGADDSPRQIKTPEYRLGYCELKVARPSAKLSVYVKANAPSYRPGDTVTVHAEVLDFEGRPVPRAEVTLYAVDEGVLSLTGYETPDPLAFFNQPRPLFVSTALTLPTLMDEDPDHRSFANKGYLIGGGGEDDGLGRLRKNFVACAFWSAALETDAQGRIAASFVAPDSLTRYRIIAVVHTAREQFGSAAGGFEVNKPVMLEPALPRFANIGDKLLIRAVLHNTTDHDGEAEIRIALDETASAASTTRALKIAAHGSAAVDVPVEFLKAGKAQWKWTARFQAAGGEAFGDSVQTELNVGYPAPLLREVRVGRVEAAEANLLDQIDPQLLEGSGMVRVSVTNSRAIEMREALQQLLRYPYGCVEQTTSSTLPWLTLRSFRDALPDLAKTDAEIASAIQRGVNRLLSMQTSSGGLGYWPGASEPMLWGSAYGGLGLALAKRQGAFVPGDDYERLMKFISEQLRGSAEMHDHYGLTPRCLAVYTLAVAGQAEPAYHELLFKKRSSLSSENRALLALAIVESGGARAMVEELLKSDVSAGDSGDAWFRCGAREQAMQLLAWCAFAPDNNAVDRLATEIFAGRRSGHWWTTQGNAWSLLAVAGYLERVERGYHAGSGSIVWGSQTAAFKLGSGAQVFTSTFPITRETALEPLRIAKPGRGRVFTEVTVEARPQSFVQPRQDRGYSITRRYEKIADDGELSELNNARVGDRVLVTLDIEVRQRAGYLAVEDPLPAIFEAVNPAFESQETRAAGLVGNDWVSDYRELREDRALFFADAIFPGRYTLRYLARVCAAGTATAPAAKIEEMYHPERFGMTETMQVASLPLK